MRSELQHSNWIADRHSPRWLWLLLIALPLVAIIAFVSYQTAQVLPRLTLVPGYSLLDQNGETLTNEMMRGKLVIYAFTQPECDSPCLDKTLLVQQLQQLRQDANAALIGDFPLHFVIVSSDHETMINQRAHAPATVQEIAQESGGADEQWHFVSSDPDQFRNILQAESQAGDAINEGAVTLALVDGWGIVRALYPTADLARLRHDLRLVTQEARNSTGVNRYAYETVHLFMCHSDLNATTYTQQSSTQ